LKLRDSGVNDVCGKDRERKRKSLAKIAKIAKGDEQNYEK
jgi:hypothetical protein